MDVLEVTDGVLECTLRPRAQELDPERMLGEALLAWLWGLGGSVLAVGLLGWLWSPWRLLPALMILAIVGLPLLVGMRMAAALARQTERWVVRCADGQLVVERWLRQWCRGRVALPLREVKRLRVLDEPVPVLRIERLGADALHLPAEAIPLGDLELVCGMVNGATHRDVLRRLDDGLRRLDGMRSALLQQLPP